ncbi:Rmd8p [Lachancea thermotolerans CBS 6340]|uniref:KLTH0G00704p n=1 Tax=Lachancea thermotolerans (strain ATCC 56472 / CBS 6340 / NRRL Y-8284) TaxID=559295 RepID=C5DLH2_LACTC|nr:KLTH0G00704p [Lachancea thermotolerans CBS 6340]CAR24633.1 KLTH0G00704p [Lachancea thermotolerans CBS 6340]
MQSSLGFQEGPGRRTSMSRRSPSILVTDARSSKKRIGAPFAGHAAGLRGGRAAREKSDTYQGFSASSRGSMRGNSASGSDLGPMRRSRAKLRQQGKFSDISIDNILSDVSDVPSGRREERLSISSHEMAPFAHHSSPGQYTKLINPLPPRTSKTSKKLVLIPEDSDRKNNALQMERRRPLKYNRHDPDGQENYDEEMSRITAYNVAEGFEMSSTSDFLRYTHDVSPRLYDECLYVPYCLPLLPGKDGFRIKSNVSKKTIGGKTLIDRLIDKSEQRDHHYEYYSGVETVEDMNNNFELSDTAGKDNERNDSLPTPDHLPNNSSNNTASFDPSEPQFFAEEGRDTDQSKNISAVGNRSQNPYMESQSLENYGSSKQQHAEIFIFSYGVVVFWNFTEIQEKNILGDIAFAEHDNMIIRPLDEQDIETEQFHFEYDMNVERPRIFNDIVTLRSGDHIIKLTLSHSIAQSTKLSRFESRISPILGTVSKLPKRLALYGTLGLKREQLLKKSGKLFKLRVDVNLSSSVLDTPEFFWSFEPSLHPLYLAMREYLEIDQRVQVLNDRCKVFLEFFDICVDSVAERNMARITWWFIAVIFVSVLVSICEIIVRSFIIRQLKNSE